ncbi:DUF2845 domain-containing protein [Pseudomonas vanderleydeniana]|uniref:DUF2845 domain-containing protein n=1 Tax=Pseudomonas vanderleydeniana TaxID=2745495 RepID=A0A9E6PLX6_9PSED|nr:DUF2845 domain-containing protein [Pseudomonas vanderleydeniana]QXI28585.1 DUF2845 domain-containing protein [Pseudomonas vanderleydeniana]
MNTASLILVLLSGIALGLNQANAATLRCSNGLISEGDTSFEVLKKCGEPADRQVTEPARLPNGNPVRNSVTVETWVYGPENGARSFLRFIDGRLVKVETRRL